MNLAEVRRQAAEATRRHDLLRDGDLVSNVDNGLNFFINTAVRWLDLKVEQPERLRRAYASLVSGATQVKLPQLLFVESIQIGTAGEFYNLTPNQFSYAKFKEAYASPVSSWNTGKPQAWTLSHTKLAPSQQAQNAAGFEAAGFVGYEDVTFTEVWTDSYIQFYPKADATYTVNVLGAFYHLDLVDDEDQNYWTVVQPDTLVLTTAYILEGRMRNRQGQLEWLQAIEDRIHQIECGTVERELGGLEMELYG